jgi:hypothetical protein
VENKKSYRILDGTLRMIWEDNVNCNLGSLVVRMRTEVDSLACRTDRLTNIVMLPTRVEMRLPESKLLNLRFIMTNIP